MNLVEKYALECGLKISEPYLDLAYMPIIQDKYIILDNRSKYPNKIGAYDYFNDVLDLLKPYLKQENIHVYQITNDPNSDLSVDRCFVNIGKKQEAYLISKSLLVVANENYSLYMASILNVLSIGLYSIFKPENLRPVWNKDKQIILESHRENNLPSYGLANESPKTINFISPYKIVENVLNALGISNNLHCYDLVKLGKNYNSKVIEVVPDFITDQNFLSDKNINLRLDYVDQISVQCLNFWLTNRKINIITNKDLNLNLLVPYRENIVVISVMISDNISENFLHNCKSLGLPLKIFCNNKERLQEFRFKFLDWEIVEETIEKGTMNKVDNLNNKSYFISSKKIISKGKTYSCKANFLLKKPIDRNRESVIFSDEFEQEIEFFKVYNETEDDSHGISSSQSFRID